MRLITSTILFLCFLALPVFPNAQADVFELRIYTVNNGKLDALNARFRDHTVRLFKKHGMESVGYWVPTDEPFSKNTLVYVLKHKSRESAKKSWAAFVADPDWQKAYKASRENGPIVKKLKSEFMQVTDYSPTWKNGASDEDDVFELRIYKAKEGKLAKLDARFRDHTIRIFQKHGMKSVAYWHPTDKPDSNDKLIYIIKHDNRGAAKNSWRAFSADPAWQKAAKESGVGKLAKRPESIYMKSTDYSQIK